MSQDVLFDLAPTALVVLSYRHIQQVNQAFLDLFGYVEHELLGKNMQILFPTCQDYEEIGAQAWQGMLKVGERCYSDQRFMRHKNGALFWVKTHARSLTPDDPFRYIIWHFDAEAEQPIVQLTPREKEISRWVVNGYSCKQIARELGVSHRTIEVHVANLKKKFTIQSKKRLASKMVY